MVLVAIWDEIHNIDAYAYCLQNEYWYKIHKV